MNSSTPSKPPCDASTAEPDWRIEAKRRYDLLNDAQRADYTARKQTIDTSHRDDVFMLLDMIEPFNTVNVPMPALEPESHLVEPPTPPDEGATVNQVDVDALKTRFDALGAEAQLWTATLVAEGNNAFSFRLRDVPSVRRYEIYRGILALAELGPPDDIADALRGLLYTSTDREEAADETLTLGSAISLLDAAEAAAFALACDDYRRMKEKS